MTTVLYTGGTGRMGQVLRRGLAGRYERSIVYARGKPEKPLHPGEEVVAGDLSELDKLTDAAAGVDVIVHFGGVADEAPFSEICQANIHGTYNVYEAARRAGVRRVVYASSNHVVGFHRAKELLDEQAPLRPDTHYGVSKAFGEAVGSLYHDKWGIESVILRIGTFRPEPEDERQLALWLSWTDGVELVRCAIESAPVGCQIVYGCSANTRRWWNGDAGWAAIGYTPQDDAEDYASRIHNHGTPPEYHGGAFTASDYEGGIW